MRDKPIHTAAGQTGLFKQFGYTFGHSLYGELIYLPAVLHQLAAGVYGYPVQGGGDAGPVQVHAPGAVGAKVEASQLASAPSASRSSSTAPAPSPNKMHVVRSV